MLRFTRIILAATALIMALAGAPQAQNAGRTILVLDASGSMWGQIDGKAKITIAQEVIAALLQSIPEDQALGLTAYGHRRKGDCSDIETLVAPGSGTRQAIASAVNAIKPRGKTPLSAAVIAAAESLKYTEEKATVILVSDGRETCDFDPCEVGRRLAETGVDFTAHVIGFDVAKKSDRAQLQCLAENTGGTFRTASNAAELTEALKVVSEPSPPAPGQVRFIATEGEGGPRLSDGLVWTLTNLDSGDVITDLELAAELDLPLLPGTYRAEVLRSDNETEASAEITVFQNTDTTVTLVLPLIIPAATLGTPATAFAGETINVVWDGPDETGDFLTTANVDERDSAYITYSYTRFGSPLGLQMPPEPGTYEIRYVLDQRRLAIARATIEVLPVAASIQIPDQASAGDTLTVTWSGPNYKGDFLSTARPDVRNSLYETYTYTSYGSPTELTMPAEPGEYEVRYVMSQGSTVIFRKGITILPVGAALEMPDTAAIGEPVLITWRGPDYELDFVSVARIGDRDSKYLGYAYTSKGSPLRLKMPTTPGRYEVRYVQNQDSTVLVRREIEIVPLEVRLTLPASAKVGETVLVEWDGPGYDLDYMTVAEIGSRDSKYLYYTYTRDGSPLHLQMPATPGDYEIRYVANASPDAVLASAVITLEPVDAAISAAASGAAGTSLEVQWQGPDYKGDYIAIAPRGGDRYQTYTYAREGSPLAVRLPDEPGDYEIWYVMDVGSTVLARQDLTVTAP